MEKNMETTIVYWGYIEITSGFYRGCMRIMEKKMDICIVGYIGSRV